MPPILPTECMKSIFQYIKNNNESLYPSLLVNCYWYNNVVELLWACLFNSLNFDNFYKITPIYISLLNENEKNQLKILLIKNSYEQNSILKLKPNNKPLFNYSLMLKEFFLKSLENIVQSWIAVYNPLEIGHTTQSIHSINFLVKISESCKQIDNLIVKIPAFEKNNLVKKHIISIINAQEKLKQFSLRSEDNWLEEIINTLQSQTNLLVSINLECINISESSLISLAKFKNLENLVILNYFELNIILRNDIEFKNLKRLYIKNYPLININMPNLDELSLEVLTHEVIVSIIKNCPNITHFSLKNYHPSSHDWIFKDFIQELKITHLVIKFLNSNSIISEYSILSKVFFPLTFKYLEINCGLITIYLDSLMDDYCYMKLKELIIKVMKLFDLTDKPQFDDIINQSHTFIPLPSGYCQTNTRPNRNEIRNYLKSQICYREEIKS
ncbi:15775_t:CDS:2 [Gigaspora margarita]|uniref:15775_t:CDS:1 n=1 Tax=Gigaspora margarita TaxID=4874 RepID=A0ABN7UTB5_GIGMA|nr:15775_t:CDS:2 [Gigaspora margarita]